jgi:hypothetical protein
MRIEELTHPDYASLVAHLFAFDGKRRRKRLFAPLSCTAEERVG